MAKPTSPCPVCGEPASHEREPKHDFEDVYCPRCGKFRVSGTALAILGKPDRADRLLNTEEKIASVGHWIRSRNKSDDRPLLTSDVVRKLADKPWFPSLLDQRANLLKQLAELTQGPGERINYQAAEENFEIGTKSWTAISSLMDRLQREGLVVIHSSSRMAEDEWFQVSLTFEGWLAFEELQRGRSSGRTAFMAMPFNKADLDSVWLPSLRAAVAETGFALQRVDDEPRPGLIDVRMRLQIKEARFLIVELTHANQGAYWEAGFAEGMGKPVIYTLKKGEEAHFDVDHSLRVEWDPENISEALSVVKATIRNELPDALPNPS